MPYQDVCKILDEAKDFALEHIQLTGGEPLLHPNFFEILERTKIPLKSLISEGFFLFFVYCGAKGECIYILSFRATLDKIYITYTF